MSPRPNVEEQRRAEVLTATCEMISEVGFNRVRVADVAERVGISTGIIHYYFGSKKNLLDEAFNYAVARARERSLEALDGVDDPWLKIEALLDAHLPGRGTPKEWLLWMHLWAESVVRPELRLLNQAAYSKWIDLVDSIVAEGQSRGTFRDVSTRDFTVQFLTMMDGLVIQQSVRSPGFTSKRIRELILAFARATLLGENADAPEPSTNGRRIRTPSKP